MKRKLLMLTLALACLLCLFAIQAAATGNDTPALSINYTNLSFKDSVYIKYAVAAENVTPEDVRLLVFTEPQDDYTDESKATVLMPKYLDTVNGAEHIIFDYTNLSAKQMTDVVYARAMVTVGEETYYSNIKKFNILQYADAVIHNPSAKQALKNMLAGMLDYGALAQTYFDYQTNRPANGEWYEIQVKNGTLSDGFTSGMFLRNDQVTLTADPAPEAGMLPHWLNSAGEVVGREAILTVTALGSETYTMVYADSPLGVNEGLEFALNEDGNTYTLVGIGNCKDTEIYIPAEYNDKKVTAIGFKALAELSGVTKIVVGENVTTIGARAFYACPDLVELTIPASVTSIGNQITYKSNNLTTVYYDSSFVPDSASSFLKQASITHVVFNGTYVPGTILSGATNIQKITVGKNVKSINSGNYDSAAFYGCTNLTEVVFEENSQLKSIGSYAFYNCTSLKSVYITDLAAWCAISFYDYYSNPLRNGADLYINGMKATDIVIPDGVTSIGDYVFYGCRSLTSIVIPDSVTSIGSSVFHGCSSLASMIVASENTVYHSDGNCLIETATKTLIAGCKNSVIPHDGSVTSIGYAAFYNCSSLTSIEIPDSVTSIGDSAFYGCSSLKSVYITDLAAWCEIDFDSYFSNPLYYGADLYINGVKATDIVIPDSVTSIGYYVFHGCTSLASITIPDSVSSIGDYAFHGCRSLTRIVIHDSVLSIGYAAFSGCSSLASIEIPDSVMSIGDYAFSGCTGLTSITIPDSVTSIGYSAFYDCSSLESITLPFVGAIKDDSLNTHFGYIFGADSYNDNEYYIPSSLKEAVITGGTSIDEYAFSYCYSLMSIVIPDSVTEIAYCAFWDCSNLTSITLPFIGATKDGIENMHFGYIFGDDSYSDDEDYVPASLKEVIITGSTSISDYAFFNCKNLTSIEIPDSVSSIGYFAFYNCSSLTSITIPDSVTSVGYSAFYNCSSLTSITIPDSVTSIGDRAFYNCSSLTSMIVAAENTVYHSDGNCLIETATKTLIAGCNNSVIPDNGSVTSIGDYAFSGRGRLTSITIPDSVTSIGYAAFYNCSSLTSIEIPDSVASIGGNAFYGCTGIIQVENGVSYVDKWAIDCDVSVTAVSLRSGTISIGPSAFYNCSSLTSITIPDSVTSIGDRAFYNCSSLTSMIVAAENTVYHSEGNCLIETATKTLIVGCNNSVIPHDGSVTSIGSSAFYGCSGLTSITIPDSVTHIGGSAFYGCTSLASIEIPASVTSIGNYAFEHCSSLTSIEIPNSVTSIGYAMFRFCSSLTSIEIPDSVMSIDENAFYYCSSLKNITIPDSVTSIGNFAFMECSSLTSITIPDSVTSIGDYAFAYCSSLKTVYYGGTADDWNGISISSSNNSKLTSATRYYYAETQPTEAGNYWRYVDGVPTAW